MSQQRLSPTSIEMLLAGTAKKKLESLVGQKLRFRIVNADDMVELPPVAVRALVDLLRVFARGGSYTLQTLHDQLTIAEAAEFLGVSQRFVFQQLSDGTLNCNGSSGLPQLQLDDLIKFKQQLDEVRSASLDALAPRV